MPSATASQKSASPIRPKKSSQMPAEFNLSFSPRWILARSRHHDFPASPVFSQLESGDGVNLSYTPSRNLAQFNCAVHHRVFRRQKAKSLNPNFQHSSLQVTSKRRRVPSFNRLPAFPQDSRTSHVCRVARVQPRVRTSRRPHSRRVRLLLSKRRCHCDPPPYPFLFSEFQRVWHTFKRRALDWPKTTKHA